MCGNFGILLLHPQQRAAVLRWLQAMLRITMVRGAQSAGIVTYEPSSGNNAVASRCRVVNGKRTDLATLLLTRLARTDPVAAA